MTLFDPPCRLFLRSLRLSRLAREVAAARRPVGHAREPVFSSVIRIQTDRGQHVVTTGPYAFVRHSGYTAGILIIAAGGPALGSWLAAALVVIFSLPFLLYRVVTEDRILQAELAGYSDYAARVRWRLVPGIW